jgi:hypothetical protein
MKRLAFLSFTIATLIAPIQVQARQNCVTFPQNSTPEEQLRYLLAHPNARVCPSRHPDQSGQSVQRSLQQGVINPKRPMEAMSDRKSEPSPALGKQQPAPGDTVQGLGGPR